MSAEDYPVTFRYGATSYPYSASNPHPGNDRKCSIGTPVVIAGVTIGWTGNTGSYNGKTYQPHLHTQAWTGTTTNTRDPGPYEFKPGKVVGVGFGRTWGYFVTIEVNGVNCTYAHLSKINVRTGQVIKAIPRQGDKSMNPQEENEFYQIVFERPMEHGGSGRTGIQVARDGKPELAAKRAGTTATISGLRNERDQLANTIRDLKTQLQAAQNKPPEIVVKEVEKIVEKCELPEPVTTALPVQKPSRFTKLLAWFIELLNKKKN